MNWMTEPRLWAACERATPFIEFTAFPCVARIYRWDSTNSRTRAAGPFRFARLASVARVARFRANKKSIEKNFKYILPRNNNLWGI